MLIFRSDSKGNYERNIKVLWNTCGSSCNLWPKQDIKVKKEEIIKFFYFFHSQKIQKNCNSQKALSNFNKKHCRCLFYARSDNIR